MIYIGFFARAILQFVSFYLIVNIFTPNDYGMLTSYLAVNGLSIVFADLGAYSLTIRQISNSKNIGSTISRNIGNAIFGSIGSILFIYLASNFFRNSLDVSIILGFSSIVLQVVSATALGYAIALKAGKAAAGSDRSSAGPYAPATSLYSLPARAYPGCVRVPPARRDVHSQLPFS